MFTKMNSNDNVLDLETLLIEEMNKAADTDYINCLSRVLDTDDDRLEENLHELKVELQNSLPADKVFYLQQLLKTIEKTDNFHLIDKKIKKYLTAVLIVLITAPIDNDEAAYFESVRLFMNICLKCPGNILETCMYLREVFNNFIPDLQKRKMLNIDNIDLMKDFVHFLEHIKLPLNDLKEIIVYMSQVALQETDIIYKDFNESLENKTAKFYAFVCLNSICNNRHYAGGYIQEIYLHTLYNISNGFAINSPVLQVNLRNFFNLLVDPYENTTWLVNVFITLGQSYSNRINYFDMINALPIKFYDSLCIMLCKTFQRDHENDFLIYEFLVRPHPLVSTENSTKFALFYHKQLFDLMKRESDEDVQFACTKFLRNVESETFAIQMNRLLNDSIFRNLFRVAFMALAPKVNLTWRTKDFNKLYLRIMWNFYCRQPSIMGVQHITMLENLTQAASAYDLKDCIPTMIYGIRIIFMKEKKVALFLYGILVKHAYLPTPVSSFYLQALYDLTFKNFVFSNNPANINKSLLALEFLKVLFNAEHNFIAIVKKMLGLNLITDATIEFLCDYFVFERTGALQITLLLIQRKPYIHRIPTKIRQFLFSPPEQIVEFGQFNLVLHYLVFLTKANGNLLREQGLKNTLINLLGHSLRTAKLKEDGFMHAIVLLEHLYEVPIRNIEDLRELFTLWLVELQQTLDTCNVLLITLKSHLIKYVSDLILMGNLVCERSMLHSLKRVFASITQFEHFEDVWANLLILYTNICITTKVPFCYESIEYSLTTGPAIVKSVALAALYDYLKSNHRDMRPYLDWMFKLLIDQSRNEFISFTVLEKLVKYLDKVPVQVLSYEETFLLIKSLMDFKQTPTMLHFFILFNKKLLNKYAEVIGQNLSQLVIHLNASNKKLPTFNDTISDNLIRIKYPLYKKQILYKMLFYGFSSYVGFNMLHKISVELLDSIVERKISIHEHTDALYDAFLIITIQSVKYLLGDLSQTISIELFFEQSIDAFKKCISLRQATQEDEHVLQVSNEFNDIIENVCCNLLKLILELNTLFTPLIQDAFFAFCVFFRAFRGNIQEIIMNKRTNVLVFLKRLPLYYTEYKHEMHYLYEPVDWQQWHSIF